MPDIQQDVDLTSLNSFGLASKARYLASVVDEQGLLEDLAFAKEQDLDVFVLGGGTNIVLTGNIDGLVIHMASRGISIDRNGLTAEAGENWDGVVQQSLAAELYGLENLSLIPGSAGAAPMQNIGAYGVELVNVFESLNAVHRHTLEKKKFASEECDFSYRDSWFKHGEGTDWVVTSVSLYLNKQNNPDTSYPGIREKLEQSSLEPTARNVSKVVCELRQEKLPDPATTGNVGSFFKNPIVGQQTAERLQSEFPGMPQFPFDGKVKLSAAWLIDNANLKGKSVGGIQVAPQHALVLVNNGNGSSADVLQLVNDITSIVTERYDLSLEVEPRFYPTV